MLWENIVYISVDPRQIIKDSPEITLKTCSSHQVTLVYKISFSSNIVEQLKTCLTADACSFNFALKLRALVRLAILNEHFLSQHNLI